MGLLRDFALWWVERITELLPGHPRDGRDDARDALIVEIGATPTGAPGFLLFLRRAGRESVLAHAALDPASLRVALPARRPATVLLRPPASALLEREVVLPPAAEPELNRVLAHEMDRLTPFTAAELYWRWDVAERDRARGRLRVLLSLVLRAPLAPASEAMVGAGVAPSALTVRRADGTSRRVGLAQPGGRARTRHRYVFRLATAGCLALAVTAGVLPFARQEGVLREVEREMTALRPAVAEVEALRRRLAAAAGGSDVLMAETLRVGSALDTLTVLTALLPDDTFLSALSLRERRLTLAGQSAAAAQLIPLLSAAPSIREPAFLSPVTRAEAGAGEIFSLRAELAP